MGNDGDDSENGVDDSNETVLVEEDDSDTLLNDDDVDAWINNGDKADVVDDINMVEDFTEVDAK